MKYSPKDIGEAVKSARKSMSVTQKDLALTSGTGLRFIVDLEKGKPTCELGKVLTVLQTLGITITLVSPLRSEKTPAPSAGAKQKAKGA